MSAQASAANATESAESLQVRIKSQLSSLLKSRGKKVDLLESRSDFLLDVDLDLPANGITAIFGASGSGKTTLLRCIAGLQAIDAGCLRINNETWHGSEFSMPAHKRSVGYVFQEASLFDHLNVEGNLNYALKRANDTHAAIDKQQVIELMGIDVLLNRQVQELSGGERQRVAIARALLINPQLLLMDEPLAALDMQRRQEILPYLERLHQEIAIPILYVTHSMEEVTRLADYLVVLDQGKVTAAGNLVEMLARSDLSFGGEAEVGAVLEGEIISRNDHWHLATVAFPGGEMQVRDSSGLGAIGKQVRIRILARDISLSLEAEQRSSILNRLPVEIVRMSASDDPAMATIQLKAGESYLLARVSLRSVEELNLQAGQQLWAQIKSVAILR